MRPVGCGRVSGGEQRGIVAGIGVLSEVVQLWLEENGAPNDLISLVAVFPHEIRAHGAADIRVAAATPWVSCSGVGLGSVRSESAAEPGQGTGKAGEVGHRWSAGVSSSPAHASGRPDCAPVRRSCSATSAANSGCTAVPPSESNS